MVRVEEGYEQFVLPSDVYFLRDAHDKHRHLYKLYHIVRKETHCLFLLEFDNYQLSLYAWHLEYVLGTTRDHRILFDMFRNSRFESELLACSLNSFQSDEQLFAEEVIDVCS